LDLEESASVDGLGPALSALDSGDVQAALDALIAALPTSGALREPIRRIVVGVLDDLGVENPLALEYRGKLASALY
jgi:thioredoxin-like negative regulator of GroEL